MHKRTSTLAKLGLPAPFGEIVLTVALVLFLAPYLSDTDLGIFKVPAFPAATQHVLRYTGPLFLLGAILLYLPLWRATTASLRSAGTDRPLNVIFTNASRNYLNVDWIDFDGRKDPEHHYSLAPGETQQVATYVAHAWEVSNANTGEQIRSIVVTEKTPSVVIR